MFNLLERIMGSQYHSAEEGGGSRGSLDDAELAKMRAMIFGELPDREVLTQADAKAKKAGRQEQGLASDQDKEEADNACKPHDSCSACGGCGGGGEGLGACKAPVLIAAVALMIFIAYILAK